jgi:ABC-type transport system involved in multi-copper enzyme maturation permease subunit
MKLFGPILFYDLLRTARRSRYTVLRCLYALLLLALMYPVYQTYFHARGPFAVTADPNPAKKLVLFGETFFYVFMTAQFIVVSLLTPAYVAGAIADEKHQRTLEYILATDLRNREIILGKFTSRLLNLILFLFAGMPVLSLNLLFGGVSVELLWCGFAATAVTMLSLAALSVLQSVYARRTRDAMIRTYVIVIGYFAFWGLLELFKVFLGLDKNTPAEVYIWINAFLDVYNTGNPFVMIAELIMNVRATGTLGMKPFEILGYYSLFHGTLTLVCLTRSILLVRWVYIGQMFGRDAAGNKRSVVDRALFYPVRALGSVLFTRKARLPSKNDGQKKPKDLVAGNGEALATVQPRQVAEKSGLVAEAQLLEEAGPSAISKKPTLRERLRKPLWRRRRPPIGRRPMLWKELYCERTLRLGVLGELAFAALAFVVFLPLFIVTGVAILNYIYSHTGLDDVALMQFNGVVRLVGTLLASFILIGTVVRSANCIGAEQNRLTFETLLGTPLTNFEILSAKWLGSAVSQRWTFGLLAVVWLLATISGAIHWLALGALLLTLGVLVAFTTSLGLVLATRSKSAGRAAATAVIILLALSGLPWLIQDSDGARTSGEIFSPPRLLFAAAFWQGDYDEWKGVKVERPSPNRGWSTSGPSTIDRWRPVIFPVAGLVFYSATGALLWLLALYQFRERCGRIHRRPVRKRVKRAAPAKAGVEA